MHVLGISGSLRKASHNTGLLRAAMEVLPEGVTLERFDLTPIPFYNSDLESRGEPAAVTEMKARIAAADALLIATPEYNYSVSGVLKNALDWASRPVRSSPLNGKPLAMMGAGGSQGTVRAQMHLRQILLHNGVLVLPKPELYVYNAREKFDAEGNLTDERTRQSLRALLEALLAWTGRA
jgi:chromate reductase, NAD(P)H dehydrogenase (quinone)